MSRIKLSDNGMDGVIKMADGNPGAIVCLGEMIKQGREIDPEAMMGGLGAILILDTLEIYGTDIYILFNDQCKRDVRKMLMLLRAYQLGFISGGALSKISSCQTREKLLCENEINSLDDKVCERLDKFAKKVRNTCNICKRKLNVKDDLTSEDCGGDCLRCMAEIGEDPYCIKKMYKITKEEKFKPKEEQDQ